MTDGAPVSAAPRSARDTDPSVTSVPAHAWLVRRLRRLGAAPHATLTALALLGGEAPDRAVTELATAMAGSEARIAAVESILTEGCWVTRPEARWLTLTSRTLRDVLLDAIPRADRDRWHAAAARAIRRHGGPLALADAAWHAAQAREGRAASELANRAASAASRALLETAEAELLAFAADQEATGEGMPLEEDTDTGTSPPTYRMPPLAIAELLDAPSSGTLTPPSVAYRARQDTLPEGQLPSSTRPRAPTAPPIPPAPPTPTRVESAEDTGPPTSPFAVHLSEQDPLATTTRSPVMSPVTLGDQLAELARDALVHGKLDGIDTVLTELRRLGTHTDFVDRVSAIVALGRGAKGDALRQLRAAADVEQPPAKKARALLAYAVALAAAGRTAPSLLTALSALACAREASDSRGEAACARFLDHLYTASGHGDAASPWSDVAAGAALRRAD